MKPFRFRAPLSVILAVGTVVPSAVAQSIDGASALAPAADFVRSMPDAPSLPALPSEVSAGPAEVAQARTVTKRVPIGSPASGSPVLEPSAAPIETLEGAGGAVDDLIDRAAAGTEALMGGAVDLDLETVSDSDIELLEAIRQARRMAMYLQAQTELASQASDLVDVVSPSTDEVAKSEVDELREALEAAKIKDEILALRTETTKKGDVVRDGMAPTVEAVVVEVIGDRALLLFADRSMGEEMVRQGQRLKNGWVVHAIHSNGVVVRAGDGYKSFGLAASIQGSLR